MLRPRFNMELTVEIVKEHLKCSGATDGGPISPGKRQASRTRVDAVATLLPFSDQFGIRSIVVPVRDLSIGGFSFLHDKRLPLGEQFGLVLPEESGRPIAVLCAVAHYQQFDADLYLIGAKFCQILGQRRANLPLELDPVVPPRGTETRRAS